MKSCELCNAIEDSGHRIPMVWNQPLYQTENFKILPTIGPFVEGHTIILSKDHYECLASMGYAEVEEAIKLMLHIVETFPGNILFTEHGSYNQQLGGACIVHTHIHVIPGFGDLYNILEGILPVYLAGGANETIDLSGVDFPYIMNANSSGKFIIYKAYNAHSQMMRKMICAETGRNDGDWTRDPKLDVIESTVKLWQK